MVYLERIFCCNKKQCPYLIEWYRPFIDTNSIFMNVNIKDIKIAGEKYLRLLYKLPM